MEVSLSSINPHLPPWTDARVLFRTKKKHQKHQRTVESTKAHSRGRSLRGKRNNLTLMSQQTREDQRLFLALPLLLKINGVRRSCSQGHRRVRSAILRWAETHSVLACTRKGTSPEMPRSVEPQLPSRNVCDLDPDTRTRSA